MDGKHPKRRKDKYNPYTISEAEGKYYLSFRDGQGKHHKLEVNKRLFDALNRFELEDLSFLNQVDRHYEHSELTEISLYDRAAMPAETVEDTVLRNLQHQALYRAIGLLPETQKRRLLLYYFDGLTYAQIAELENCKYQTVQESIYAALKKLKNFLK